MCALTVTIVVSPGNVISCCTFNFGAVLCLVRLTSPHQRPQVDVILGLVISYNSVRFPPLQGTPQHKSVLPFGHFIPVLFTPVDLPGIHVVRGCPLCPRTREAEKKGRGREPGKCNRCTVPCALTASPAQVTQLLPVSTCHEAGEATPP